MLGLVPICSTFLDVYDLTEDRRSPKLLSSSPAGILGLAAPTLPATGGGAPLGLALAAALSGAAALWLATRGRRAARP